jgi:hypothetical protein
MNVENNDEFEFDIAISFAGENRDFAKQLADIMNERGVKVFYDRFSEADLWGEDLIERLTEVYSNKARYCLLLISKYYPDKAWTRVERRSAQARALRQPEAYILPLRLDDTPIPGLPSTVAYVDARSRSPEEIVDLIEQKLKGTGSPRPPQKTTHQPSVGKYNVPRPQIKRKYSELEKDRFIESSFRVIRDYFGQGLEQLKREDAEVETDLREEGPSKFIGRIYIRGELAAQCKIWLGSDYKTQAIFYLEGSIDVHRDNSYNEFVSIDEQASEIKLKLSGMAIGIKNLGFAVGKSVSSEQAAEYLWRRFTSHLENQHI